jgi:hypothetical protein
VWGVGCGGINYDLERVTTYDLRVTTYDLLLAVEFKPSPSSRAEEGKE